jgi:hypothetical protein
MNKKIGRPKVPKKQARTVLLGTMIAPEEKKDINQAIAASGQDKSKWLRQTIHTAIFGERIIIQCPEAQDKYDGQWVVFYFMDGDKRIALRGKFRVWLGPESIAIVINGFQDGKVYARYLHLPQVAVDSIQPLEEGPTPWEVQQPVLFSPKHC